MAEPYEEALRKAEQQLAESAVAIDQLERQRAKLLQTVAVLRSLLGVETATDQSITDAILMVTKASSGFVTAAQVMDRLVMMGYQVQATTVATILSRLAKSGQLISAVGPDKSTGYAWRDSSNSRFFNALETAGEQLIDATIQAAASRRSDPPAENHPFPQTGGKTLAEILKGNKKI